MSQFESFEPKRRAARLASGIAGVVIGLGVVTSVVQGMAARSHGQSLGQFMADQRAIATSPMAQAEAPATAATAAIKGRRGG